ncbi:FtsK/SpoIIIE domain-containing protein [Hyphomicrobium sp. LHD-15]|uniref:FtsK/SpoIIIE domain-containing protein n=1 Tax=Hyphomicrobium sp. LHD-15 TaxID=3072142 RepID=UPI00280C87B6|nr:FtsK/SpoIIIE domain-containing protein [Hyphomicrobium sp. LHD-15]MDQ8699268.1 FtsK/SpoIIIE domain-containing protein [Hyphomicrobium sp. LHD-15]
MASQPFDGKSSPPPAVTEYNAMLERQAAIWNGRGLDGVIEAYRSMTVEKNRASLHETYLHLLRRQAEPNPLPRIDFHEFPKGARPHLLGLYLGTLVGGVYPRLCWQSSDIARGTLTYIFPGGPADTTTWRQKLPVISAWLGDHWTIANETSNTITLVRRTPLPETLLFSPSQLKDGALFLGVDADTQKPVMLPFADMTSGTFIPGASGTGKSNALHIIIQSLLANARYFQAIYLVDGKDGVAFNRYRNAAPGRVHVLWQDAEVWKLATDLTAVLRHRNELQRNQGIDNATRDFIAVVIDEMATFTARPSVDSKNPDNKLHAKFIDDLTLLARRGRSGGLRLIVSAQEPVVEQIPASVRANCLTSIAFRLPVDAHATAMFGQLDGLPTDPRRLPRGQALFKNGLSGDVRRVQFPVMRRT